MKYYKTTETRNSIGPVDVGYDLWPYKFEAIFIDNDHFHGKWLARLIIKANEAGLKGIKVNEVTVENNPADATFRKPEPGESYMLVTMITDKHPKE